MYIETIFSPALYPFYNTVNSIVVVVDIFRATTSICTAFHHRIKSVRTVADIEEARLWKSKGYLVAAERNVQRVDFADFGNSPFEFTEEKVKGKELIFTTTNGTQAIDIAQDADQILIGAFSNLEAISEYCTAQQKDITILCAGWNNKVCIEDTLFAGSLSEKLLETGKFEFHSDSVKTSLDLWDIAKTDLFSYIRQTEHYGRLVKNNLQDSVNYCLTPNTAPIVPIKKRTTEIFIL